jgi:hypothetical protein
MIARRRYRLLIALKDRVCTSVSNFAECVSSDPLHNGGRSAQDYELEINQHVQASRQTLPPSTIDDAAVMRRAQVLRSLSPLCCSHFYLFLLPLPFSSHLSVPRSPPSALCAAKSCLFLSFSFSFVTLATLAPICSYGPRQDVCLQPRTSSSLVNLVSFLG